MTDECALVYNTITSRRSVRKFKNTPVEEEKITACLEAARAAPSWANSQCWHFIVVSGRLNVDGLGVLPGDMKDVPMCILACGDPGESGNTEGKAYYLVDVAIATEHLVLEAMEQGLGTIWIASFKEEAVKKQLGIPDRIKVVAVVPIGYPAESATKKAGRTSQNINRKPLSEFVHYDRW
jgi:nitroreductase